MNTRANQVAADMATMPDRVAKSTAKKAARSSSRSRPNTTHVDARARTSRAQEDSRNELFERVDESKEYIRPTSTEAPPARAGMKQRWIRVGLAPNIDEKNLTRKLREGWRARHSDTVPKNFQVPRVTQGRFAGTIMVEGLLLCEMPLALAKKREAYYKALTKIKTDAVNDSLLRVNEGARGGFGPIRKGERSKLVREVPAAKESAGELEDVDLT